MSHQLLGARAGLVEQDHLRVELVFVYLIVKRARKQPLKDLPKLD